MIRKKIFSLLRFYSQNKCILQIRWQVKSKVDNGKYRFDIDPHKIPTALNLRVSSDLLLNLQKFKLEIT